MRNFVNSTSDGTKSIKEQREELLKLNNDIIYGVYDIYSNQDGKIKLKLVDNILTCYPNQLSNLKGLDKNQDISILDINSLRKGEIKTIFGKEVENNENRNLTLLFSGVIELIDAKKADGTYRTHIFTSLRDGGAADKLQRTGVAGRNSFDDLNEELEREYSEENPFLLQINGLWTLATTPDRKNETDAIADLKTSIQYFLTNKYNLDRNNPEQTYFIKMFERSFRGKIKYEELGDILREVISNNRFKFFENEELDTFPGLEKDMRHMEIVDNLESQISSGNYFIFHDKANNTIEYRSLRKIKIPKGFNPRQRLFLESENQSSKTHRIEDLGKDSLVPTMNHFAGEIEKIIKKKDINSNFGLITSKFSSMNDLLSNLDSQINSKNGKSIVFDIDGVLIDAGLEVGAKSRISVESYFEENTLIIDRVKSELKELELKGFEIILCTGRGDNFATRVGNLVLGGNYSRVISEGGVLIRDKDSEAKVTQGLEKNSKYINDIKQDLINHIISIGGFFEEGKEYVLSFNPMENTDIMKFKNILINYLEEQFPDFNEYLLITNSQTAVDILPLGTDKIIALNQVINGKHMTYFGDSNNDIPALKEAHIGIVAANAKDDFKKEVRGFGEVVLTTHLKEIGGVLEGLRFLNNIK